MTHNAPATIIATRFLALDEGRIAYDDTKGNGPLVVLLPGIGDLRAEYRFVAPALARVGYRVVTMDLRGFGESDTTFTRYDGEAVGLDLIALLRHLDRALGGDKLLIEGAGHYPHVEAPEPSLAGVLPFLSANSASAKTA